MDPTWIWDQTPVKSSKKIQPGYDFKQVNL